MYIGTTPPRTCIKNLASLTKYEKSPISLCEMGDDQFGSAMRFGSVICPEPANYQLHSGQRHNGDDACRLHFIIIETVACVGNLFIQLRSLWF